MEWTNQELDELATFFAKRMTVDLEPLDPADPPPPGDPAARWRKRLRVTHERGHLPGLARRIAAVDPDDANLQQACDLLGRNDGRNVVQILGAALSVGVLLGVVGAGAGVMGVAAVVGAFQVVELTPMEPIALLQPQARAPSVTPDPYAHMSPSEIDKLEPVEFEVPDEPASVATAGEMRPNARCAGNSGDLVGYWYAGTKKPGKHGQRIVLDRTVNVRVDYPDVHNGFEKRSQVRCVLVEGDVVKLAKAPVRVPGDAYWVPLVAGSVKPGRS